MTEIMEMQNAIDISKTDVLADNAGYKLKLRQLPEVQNMTSLININDTNSILAFGQEPSANISLISDKLLATTKEVKAQEVSEMLVKLTKVMDKFDIKELEDPSKQGGLRKLFGKIKLSIEELFAKYEAMGKEVDEVYKLLKRYEMDIHKANDDLKSMYDANVEFFRQLEKYIVAGEIGLEEIEAYKSQVEVNPDVSEEEKQMVVQNLDLVKDMLSQRIYDLQIAENVAMQTCPMIRTMQLSNFNLLRKVNSSFIITLPIFKQCLIQAIQLKRQEIQARSIQQLDEKTNELLIRNAQSSATQSVKIAQMASGSSIQMETLQTTYETIRKGIEETQRVQQEVAQKRQSDALALEQMKDDMKSKGFIG